MLGEQRVRYFEPDYRSICGSSQGVEDNFRRLSFAKTCLLDLLLISNFLSKKFDFYFSK
jgi:hypothetical protein